MKTKISHSKRRIELVVDKGASGDQRKVLAAMTLFEGTGCWHLTDVRFTKYVKPNPYSGSVGADDYCASIQPENQAESDYIKSVLRECVELDSGEILWCTYHGIIKGHDSVNGYAPPSWCNFAPEGYFAKNEALAHLTEAQAYWESQPDNILETDEWRLHNPLAQPRLNVITSHLIFFRNGTLDQFGSLPVLTNKTTIKP